MPFPQMRSPMAKTPTKRAIKRTPNTWGSIFRKALKRGDDHGYAAFLADQWEKRQLEKKKK